MVIDIEPDINYILLHRRSSQMGINGLKGFPMNQLVDEGRYGYDELLQIPGL